MLLIGAKIKCKKKLVSFKPESILVCEAQIVCEAIDARKPSRELQVV